MRSPSIHHHRDSFRYLVVTAVALALVVVVLGAFVRLSNAGLSCPDWPGCYGKLLVPDSERAIAEANQVFPERPVDVYRAWLEMLHRYLAGVLGLLVLASAFVAVARRRIPGQQVALPLILVALVAFQAILGMWTVTLMLKPIVVTGHLLGGMATVALLWWLVLRHTGWFAIARLSGRTEGSPRRLVLVGLLLVALQIALGGWTSTNYAALACTDFPTCGGVMIPELDLSEALHPWQREAATYEGGVLTSQARVTIHFLHRLFALVVSTFLLIVVASLRRSSVTRPLRAAAVVLLVVLFIQVSLGISNVVLGLPLHVAVAHNAVGAILLLTIVTVYHMTRPVPRMA